MVGTTAGFQVEIIEALAPQSHYQISRKPTVTIGNTFSASHRGDTFYRVLNGSLMGYCEGKIPRVPRVIGYSPKF
jgi:hypothetical protein